MSTAQIISYVLLGLFLFSALIGFLVGLGRGFKKASLRLVVFAIFALVALLLSPIASKMLLEFDLSLVGLSGTAADIIDQQIASNAILADLIANSPGIAGLVSDLPIIVVNLITFIILFVGLSFVGWTVHMIVASIFFGKKKAAKKKNTYNVDLKNQKPKKHRLLGGLVGSVYGIMFLTLLLMPVTGIASMASRLTFGTTNGGVAYASTHTPVAELLQDNLPEEVKDGLKAFSTSPLGISTKILGADTVLFDGLTSTSIDTSEGEVKIILRKEIINFANLYNDVEFLTKIDFENIVYKDLDYAKITNAVDTVLNSKFLKIILPEALEWAYHDINKDPADKLLDIEIEPDILDIINLVANEYELSGGIYKGLRNDFNAVVEVAVAVGQSGLVDEVMKTQIDLDEIKTIVLKDNRQVITKVFGNVFKPIALRAMGVKLINEELAKHSTIIHPFSPIAYDKVDWQEVNNELVYIANNLVDMYVSLDNDFNSNIIDLVQNEPYELLNANTTLLTTKLGNIMSTLQNTLLLVDANGNKVIYNQFMDYLNTQSVSEYVDFAEFKKTNAWSIEMTNLKDLLSAVKGSGILPAILDNIDSVENIDIEDVLGKLSQLASNNHTYTYNIISPILGSGAFKKLINIGFDYLNTFIAENQAQISSVDLGKIQYSRLNNEAERGHILSFIDNLVHYASDIDIDKIQTDPVAGILESNFSRLGLALDSIKNSSLFGAYTESGIAHIGVYAALMDSLDSFSQVNNFIWFEPAKAETFSWNNEFSTIQSIIEKMQEIEVGGEDLITAIMSGGFDPQDLMSALTTQDIDDLIDPLLDSELLSKNVVMFVNMFNEQIASLTGETINEIPANTPLVSQATEIKDIIKKGISLASELSNGIGIDELEDSGAEIGALLNSLKANALANGVFEESYYAIIVYLETEVGAELTTILDGYKDQADIDWVELFDLVLALGEFDINDGITTELAEKLAALFATMLQGETYEDITVGIVHALNTLLDLDGTMTETDILNLTKQALSNLAASQNAYALEPGNTKADYADMVAEVLGLLEDLTGMADIDLLADIEDYQAEIDSIDSITTMLDAIENATIPTIEDYEDLIDALSNSDLILGMLEEQNIVIELDPLIESEVESYINDTFAGDTDLINQLLAVFGL